MHKSYIALFTCASSRGLHLEAVPDLSAESFIRALIRLTARRGNPKLIVSDNGKTFKDAGLQAYCRREGIDWKFNVEASPWWGGFFERLVRSVKRCLKKSLRTAKVTYEELSTTLVEVEGVLNSRPLTYVYGEVDEPLTPSHLMVGRRLLSKPPEAPKSVVPETAANMSRRWKFLQRRLDQFWNRWRSDYLTELREHHKVQNRSNSNVSIQLGDVVSVQENKSPRHLWRLGRVIQLLPGRDGHVRSAVVKVKSGEKGTSNLKRPIQRLYPVEVSNVDKEKRENCLIKVVRDEDIPKVVIGD